MINVCGDVLNIHLFCLICYHIIEFVIYCFVLQSAAADQIQQTENVKQNIRMFYIFILQDLVGRNPRKRTGDQRELMVTRCNFLLTVTQDFFFRLLGGIILIDCKMDSYMLLFIFRRLIHVSTLSDA
jgi:hypothetical protein